MTAIEFPARISTADRPVLADRVAVVVSDLLALTDMPEAGACLLARSAVRRIAEIAGPEAARRTLLGMIEEQGGGPASG